MKCPNCGEELKEGYLYCEKCGNDIHIVPDFEPEIENSISKTLESIIEDVAQENGGQDTEPKALKTEKEKRNSRLLFLICTFFVLVIVGVAVTGGILQYRYNSVEYQLSEATACVAKGKPEDAAAYYERAIELQSQNAAVRLELAELYAVLGQELLYLEQLRIVAEATYSNEDETEQAYTEIINFYKSKENYEAINVLLEDCTNINVLNASQSYLAKVPEFSFQEGTYAEVLPLKLSSNTAGVIYYTMDGSRPDKQSEVYTAPIFLETGDYAISAMFVNEYGIESDVVTKNYHIDIIKPAAPDVHAYSGEYIYPVMITVDIPAGCSVYYTTDGSTPTDQSNKYVVPIPMPLGKSTYKFVVYNQEGVAGDVTIREYELELQTDLTPQDASNAVISEMMERGKLFAVDGSTYEAEGKYLYIFQYALAIPEAGDYYVIAEIYEDTAGVQNKTGTDYAVNAYTGEIYRLAADVRGNYLLEEF